MPTHDDSPPQAPPAPKGIRILVVEDDRDSADGLALLLGTMGHECTVARDGVDAVGRAREFAPDVVLLDLGLPVVDGYETCRRLRAEEATRAALIVALTGWGQSDDVRRTREAGFDLHLVKPIDLAQLRELLAGGGRRPDSSAS
jgi:CheY-like chemotaxis protein